MKTFSIKEAVKAGWEVFKKDKNNLVLITLVFAILSGGFGMDSKFSHHQSFLAPLAFAFFVLSTIVKIGWYKTLLKALDGGRAEWADLFNHYDLFVKFLIVETLYVLMVVIGLVLFIVPGIYLAMKYFFVPVLAVDKNLSIKETFEQSARMTEGLRWKLLGLTLVVALLGLSGVILLLVGLLVTVPVASLAYLHVYRKLLRENVQIEPHLAASSPA